MKIPDDIRKKLLIKKDPEAEFFLDYFDEVPGIVGKTLEVGANDNNLALMLVEQGFPVVGVDLMPYSTPADWDPQEAYYSHIVGDFCDQNNFYVKLQTKRGWSGGFGLIYSVSAIEHFGLGTYNTETYRPYHDIIAMRYIYDLLKPGGVAYITVPFAGKFVELKPHWRTYDYEAVMNRLVQDFNVELFETRVVEWNLPDCGKKPSAGYVAKLTHGEPYVSCLLKLRKGKKDG